MPEDPDDDGTPETGQCFQCGAEVNHDHYCYGCSVFVCARCDMASATGGLFGPHAKEDHLLPIQDEVP